MEAWYIHFFFRAELSYQRNKEVHLQEVCEKNDNAKEK